MKPFSLYIHIPFCFHKCPYCDFNTYAVAAAPERDYTGALLAELDYRASLPAWRGRPVQTIFFGGGTPSLFSAESIRMILDSISALFTVGPAAEISLEANPGTVSFESLAGYRQGGVNRISFGAQSFQPHLLKTLGRIHSPEQVEAAVESARQAGIENINLDLIFGVPGQTLSEVRADLSAAAALGPDHISSYNLTIEKGTPFYSAWKRGALHTISDDAAAEMMDLLVADLPDRGYARYEISNFARAGFEARHNLAYWSGDDYLGLGAGAHSYLGASGSPHGLRWSNYTAPHQYMQTASAKGSAESWRETLTRESSIFEYFFLGLRKTAGVSIAQFEQSFGISVEEAYPGLRALLFEEGLAQSEGDLFALTPRGLLLMDSVLERFTTPHKKKREFKKAG